MVSGVVSLVCCLRPDPERECQHVQRDAYIPWSPHVVIHEAIPLYLSKLCIYRRPIVNLFADSRRGIHSLKSLRLHNCLAKRSLNSLHSFLMREKNIFKSRNKNSLNRILHYKHTASFILDGVSSLNIFLIFIAFFVLSCINST